MKKLPKKRASQLRPIDRPLAAVTGGADAIVTAVLPNGRRTRMQITPAPADAE